MKNKKSHFGRGLLIYAILFLIAIIIAAFVFWKYLGSYEASRPDLTMEEFLDSCDQEYWRNVAIKGSENMISSDFEVTSEILDRIYDSIKDGKVTYRKRSGEYSAETPIYTVRISGVDFARVELKQDEFAGFDYYTWCVDSVTLAEEFIPSTRTLSLTVPQNATVAINGVTVPDSMITDVIPFSELSELELSFTSPVSMDVYSVENIYDNVEVTVTDLSGAPVTSYVSDGTTYTYDPLLQPHSISIQALQGIRVQLNGVEISDEYITNTEPAELLVASERYMNGYPVPNIVTYTIPGIYTEEETIVGYAGFDSDPSDAISATKNSEGIWVMNWSSPNAYASMNEYRQDLLDDFMWAYLRFSANLLSSDPSVSSAKNAEARWAYMSRFMIDGGDAYVRTAQTIEGLMWNTSTSVDLNSLDVLTYNEFGDDCYVTRVCMDYTIVRPRGIGEISDVATFDIVFVKRPGAEKTFLVLIMNPV